MIQRIALLLLLAGCGSPTTGMSNCTPACAAGKICCSEPTHMTTDAGTAGSAYVCVPPESDGTCPKYP